MPSTSGQKSGSCPAGAILLLGESIVKLDMTELIAEAVSAQESAIAGDGLARAAQHAMERCRR